MTDQPMLSREEWDVVAELLEVEVRELRPEIRHTKSIEVHDKLVARMHLMEDLLAKVKAAEEAKA